jgi:hypothetical protein
VSGADERPWQVKAQLVEPLSKRELFAAMAMQGMFANPTDHRSVGAKVREAFSVADAMLIETGDIGVSP